MSNMSDLLLSICVCRTGLPRARRSGRAWTRVSAWNWSARPDRRRGQPRGARPLRSRRGLRRSAEEVRWVAGVAARHNAIICQAAESSAVLPLRLGVVFRSRDSLLASLARCEATVAEFLEQFGDRQEWGVKLYLAKPRHDSCRRTPSRRRRISGPARSGTDYLKERKATGSPPHGACRDSADRPHGRAVVGRSGRPVLPRADVARPSDRPKRRNGLERGLSVAFVGPQRLAGGRATRSPRHSARRLLPGDQRSLAAVPFLPAEDWRRI